MCETRDRDWTLMKPATVCRCMNMNGILHGILGVQAALHSIHRDYLLIISDTFSLLSNSGDCLFL